MKKIITIIIILTAIIGCLLYLNIWPFTGDIYTTSDKAEEIGEVNLSQEYLNDEYGFRLKYPDDFIVNDQSDDIGNLIVINRPSSDFGLQIYITVFDENVITTERIKKDLPDLEMIKPQNVIIDGKGKGLAFVMKDTETDRREVWVAFNGFLYQISTDLRYDRLLQRVLGTWKYEI